MPFNVLRSKLGHELGFSPISLVSSHVWWFFHLSLFCVILTFLNSSGQVFQRKSLIWCLHDVFSWASWVLDFECEHHRDNINIDCLVLVLSTKSLSCKLPVLPFSTVFIKCGSLSPSYTLGTPLMLHPLEEVILKNL